MKCIHKRIASFILATLIVMGLSIPAYAVDYSIDYKLYLMGVPAEQIEKMPEVIKEDMAKCYDRGGVYGGTTSHIVDIKDDFSETRGSISSSKLALDVTYVKLNSDSDGTAHRKVYGNFEWLTEPSTFKKDAVALLWGNDWAISDNYDPAFVYQYRGKETNKLYTESLVLNTKNSTSDPNAGICYNDLSLRTTVKGGNETAVGHSGWIVTELERSEGAVKTNVTVKYVKTNVGISLGGSIGIKKGDVWVSPTVLYDIGESKSNFIMK